MPSIVATLTKGAVFDSLVDVGDVGGLAFSGIFRLENPAVSDAFQLKGIPKGATLTYASYITDTGTADFNIEKRANATPFTAGTDIWTSDKQASSTSANTASFDSGSVTARDIMTATISAVASSPTLLFLYLEWTLN